LRLSSAARLRVFLLNMPTVYPHRREGHGRARSSLGPGFMAICQSRLDRRRSAGPAPVLRRHTIALGPLRNAAWGSPSGRAVHSSPSWPSPRRCAPQLSRGRERGHDRARRHGLSGNVQRPRALRPCNPFGKKDATLQGVPRHQVLAVKPHARVIVNGGPPSGTWYASCCPHRRARTQPGTHPAPGPPSPEKG
jgi:hypothetical protein